MGLALLVVRLLLVGVFLLAGVTKLLDPAGSREAMSGFGVSERFAGVAGRVLPLAEIAVAIALVPVPSARYGAVAAAVLLVSFVAAIARAMSRGEAPDCHCFGQVHSAPAGPWTLVRNGGLLGAAGFVAIGGWRHAGDSATHWLVGASAGWVLAAVLGVALVGLGGFLVWFSLQLLAQNGRVFARLEAIETAIGSGLMQSGAELSTPVRLGAGLGAAGLPVGSRAPSFVLAGVDGEEISLEALLAPGLSALLVFSDAGCGPCEALMPELADWQRVHAEKFAVSVIASGEADRLREEAARHGLRRVLLQSEREVSEAYQAGGTPMAVVIGADGRVMSPTVGGLEAIRTLVGQVIAAGSIEGALTVRQVPTANGRRDQPAPAPSRPAVSRVGQLAPELALRDLDGGLIALTDLYRERTVAIFWNPGCGFCQRMLPDLRALEDDPPDRAPQIVVLSGGEPDAVRELALRSRVLLDSDGEAMQAFGAGGTPMGVQIEGGRIATPVAVGADAVLALIRSGAGPPEPAASAGKAHRP
jgi:peroxiredoxin/uncharacterized membrane protein YphA (DoxX/SURF4 family)